MSDVSSFDSGTPARRTRASDAERDIALRACSDAHAHGRLDLDEFDDRQNAVLACRYLDELPHLLEDLPEGRLALSELNLQTQASGTSADSVAFREPHLPPMPGQGPSGFDVAIMGGSETTVARGTPSHSTIAIMGGSDLYLDEVMGPGVELTLNLYSLMGGNDIYVPEGVRVVDHTINVMAGNSVKSNASGDGSNGTLILKGLSLMAGNDVHLLPDDRRKRRTLQR